MDNQEMILGLCKELKSIREARGIKQVKVARAIGMDPPLLSRIENMNKPTVTLMELSRILEYYNMTLYDFIEANKDYIQNNHCK
ncbi:TPA: helix-turn-helix transcriptional regulator [Staphylococcus aureus]|nr:helix-turn-helix transcriptional regulator [Staphylococcus aureus]AWQ35738.1 XRE family transcriptional regulator [Staphylococcus aureus]HBI0976650.1 helix-turn-helix transcriptional regulator [Staphylococcus aureus]HCC5607606.1 helix-turn-helix transcriptional regulator [Staphylococcus aureus]HCU7114032.1 helix-turn-helix transcriptional regulator [Staphylococcus aureus]HDH9678573.1 helix-turn-helix transcriptional regulator [Staphylococcus aureus]